MNKEHCNHCVFLSDKSFKSGICTQGPEYPIWDKKVCATGPLIKLPKTSEELRRICEITEKIWRQDG